MSVNLWRKCAVAFYTHFHIHLKNLTKNENKCFFERGITSPLCKSLHYFVQILRKWVQRVNF